MKLKRLLFRSFYYFRIGYSAHWALPVALLSYITVIYQLLLRNIPAIVQLFPHFYIFAACAIFGMVVLATFTGWIHMKRSVAFRSQLDIDVEANPYNRKLIPGKEKDVLYPVLSQMLGFLIKVSARTHVLTPEDKKEMKTLQEKLARLIEGGSPQ